MVSSKIISNVNDNRSVASSQEKETHKSAIYHLNDYKSHRNFHDGRELASKISES
jgi:hypothetical protein